VRWTGKLHIATQGTYRFNLHHDDGARFTIGSTVLENCWGRQSTSQDYTTQYNCGTNTADSIELWPGTYNIDIEYHDITGNAGVELKWDAGDPNGCCSDMQGSNADPGLNLLTSEQNPATLTTTYAYGSTEDRGLPASVTETTTGGLQRSDSKTYDSYGRVLTDANAAGTETNVYSSTMPCLDHAVDRSGARTNYTCNSAGDILTTDQVVPAVAGTQQSTAQDRVTTTDYNALGQVTDVTQPGQSASTHSDYHPNGLLEDTIDPMGRETTYAYNPATWLTTKTLPPDETPDNPLTTTYGYDAAGNQTFVTKALGSQSFEWAKTYDAQNRVTSSSVPGVSTPTTYQYDQIGTHFPADAGFLTSAVTDPAGVQTTTTTDMVGRTVATQVGTQSAAPLQETVDTYSGKGNLTNVTDPSGVSTAMSYDGFAEMVTKTMNTGTGGAAASVTYTYDNAGRITDIQDQNLNNTLFGFDGDGRITSIQPAGVAAANAWQVVYDAAGDRVQTVDPNGRHRDWAYDQMGRVSQAFEYPQAGSKSDPQSSWLVTGYHYDADSELTAVDDPRGFERCYSYDNLGDQLSRYQVAADCANDPKTDLETFTYSPMSGMTGATEGSSGPSVAIAYGSANPDRIASVSEGAAATSYAYNATSGRVTSETDQLGTTPQQTGYAYDPISGRLSSVTDPFTGLAATNYTYDDAGRILSRTDIAGLTTTYAYDPAGRLSTQTAKTAGGSTVAAYGYSYDPASNITGYTQALPQVAGQSNPDSGAWAYTYDSQERLHTAQLNSQPMLTYGYDDSGDRTSVQVGSGTPTTTTYDGADRVSTVGSTAYTWDNADELTGVGGSRSYTYDTWGRQAAATVGATSVTYAYDALNRTLSRTPSSGSATAYTYAALGQDVSSATTGPDPTTYYAYAAGVPIAQQQGSTTRGYEQDPHGDLSVILDPAGTPTGTISYDPWGTQDAAIGSDATTSLLGYQSQPTDPTTGLVDMGARLYDPSQGRFTSEDSVFGTLTNPGTLNQYIYAGDSPLDNTDPTGNYAECSGCSQSERRKVTAESVAAIYNGQGGSAGVALQHGTYAIVIYSPPPPPAPAPPVSVTYARHWQGHPIYGAGVIVQTSMSYEITAGDRDARIKLLAEGAGIQVAEELWKVEGGGLASAGQADLSSGHIEGSLSSSLRGSSSHYFQIDGLTTTLTPSRSGLTLTTAVGVSSTRIPVSGVVDISASVEPATGHNALSSNVRWAAAQLAGQTTLTVVQSYLNARAGLGSPLSTLEWAGVRR
jgi:RHS repeat-associated protein